jgi:hypothetical protein
MFHEKINLILITPHGRSGSIFLQSLFDSHPQTITIPIISLQYRFDFAGRNHAEIASKFINTYPEIFDTQAGYMGKVGENVTTLFGQNGDSHLVYDPNRYKDYLIEELSEIEKYTTEPLSRRRFWIAVHIAYARFLGYNIDELKYIVFHEHNYLGGHQLIAQDFPNLFYFAMTRDPREDWLSWKKIHKLHDGKLHFLTYKYHRAKNVNRYSRFLINLFQFSQSISPERLIVIDLNRFHKLNSAAMTWISDKVDIKFQKSLLHSTINGEIWQGNSANRNPITGFDLNKSEFKWGQELRRKEVKFIEGQLHHEMNALGYKRQFSRKASVRRYPYFSSFCYSLLVAHRVPKKRVHREFLTSVGLDYLIRIGLAILRYPRRAPLEGKSFKAVTFDFETLGSHVTKGNVL